MDSSIVIRPEAPADIQAIEEGTIAADDMAFAYTLGGAILSELLLLEVKDGKDEKWEFKREGGKDAPKVAVDGTGLDAKVRVGGQTVRFVRGEGGKIVIGD